MTMAEYSLGAFALLNGARTLAYLPQIVRISRDPNGAMAVSVMTWLLFASANVATVAYALLVSGDRLVAAIFCLNTAGCGAVALLTLAKRLNARQAGGRPRAAPRSWSRWRSVGENRPPRSDARAAPGASAAPALQPRSRPRCAVPLRLAEAERPRLRGGNSLLWLTKPLL